MLIISRAGGVLSLSETLSNGSFVDLELQTHLGTVRGAAEMLAPVAYSEQPFRFLSLSECDERRLERALLSRLRPASISHSGQRSSINSSRA